MRWGEEGCSLLVVVPGGGDGVGELLPLKLPILKYEDSFPIGSTVYPCLPV